jgi:hypothetical protein
MVVPILFFNCWVKARKSKGSRSWRGASLRFTCWVFSLPQVEKWESEKNYQTSLHNLYLNGNKKGNLWNYWWNVQAGLLAKGNGAWRVVYTRCKVENRTAPCRKIKPTTLQYNVHGSSISKLCQIHKPRRALKSALYFLFGSVLSAAREIFKSEVLISSHLSRKIKRPSARFDAHDDRQPIIDAWCADTPWHPRTVWRKNLPSDTCIVTWMRGPQ